MVARNARGTAEGAGAATQVIEATKRTMAAPAARLVLQQSSSETLLSLMGRSKVGCNSAPPLFWLMKLAARKAPDVFVDSGWV